MIRSYKLKIYPNRGKDSLIDELLYLWREEVQHHIDRFWVLLTSPSDSFPPKDLMPYGTFNRQAAVKAWQIVKGAKSTGSEWPEFKGKEIDLTQLNFRILDFQTSRFDLWFRLSTSVKGKTITVPCKKYTRFLKALENGNLQKSAKLIFDGRYSTYLILFVEIPRKQPKKTNSRIGVDLGLTNSVVTSDGRFSGQEVQDVRKRTKHRTYNGPSAQKQEWNRFSKELVFDYPDTDFAVEDLLFRGKGKRPKSFRRKYNTWAYKTLARRLEELGETEGFRVIKVNPAYTSQTCPSCQTQNKGNRSGEKFRCLSCDYANHADVVGALNILSRADRVPRGLRTRKEPLHSV